MHNELSIVYHLHSHFKTLDPLLPMAQALLKQMGLFLEEGLAGQAFIALCILNIKEVCENSLAASLL